MKKAVKRGILITGTLLVVILVWGLVEPYFINLEKEKATIPNLPAAWEGEQIAAVGDFQIGMWLNNSSTVQKIAERLVDIEPRFVLFLGDYIYNAADSEEIERQEVAALIRPLTEAGIPIFAVLGNHDYAMMKDGAEPNEELAQKMVSQLEELGVVVLQNEAVALTLINGEVKMENASAEALYLVGLGASWPENADFSAAFSHVPDSAARMVVMHHPAAFKQLPGGSAPAAVAGHTHGGQIRFPFLSENRLAEKNEKPVYGWFDEYGARGNKLYINPGIGFSDWPLRINMPPEITLFTLEAE